MTKPATTNYPFTLSGEVKRFSGNGRKLGYPTANIEIKSDAPNGTFIGLTHLKDHKLPSMIFIGVPETVGDTARRAETHIFDLEDEDLYGQSIVIEVLAKMRDNRQFDSESALLDQMASDEAQARHFFLENAIMDPEQD